MVYVGCYDGRRVLVVDLERRAVVRSMRTPGAVTSLAFSPQEKLQKTVVSPRAARSPFGRIVWC